MSLVAACLILVASLLPVELRAQADGKTEGAAARAAWHGAVLLGSDGVGEHSHVFGGLETLWLPQRLGAGGGVQLGSGNGYRSTMVGGGLGIRVLHLPLLQVHAWLGPTHYAERLDSGLQRSLFGLGGGAYLHRFVGRWSLGVHLAGFAGRFDGPGFAETARVRSTRLGLGIGVGGGR